MLVLGRLEDESIIIGEGPNAVKVTVVSIRGQKVRLGFEGPKEIPINREEVHEAIQANPQP
jgi:carbon storage regulator